MLGNEYGKTLPFFNTLKCHSRSKIKTKKPWQLYNKSSLAEKADYSKKQKTLYENFIGKFYAQKLTLTLITGGQLMNVTGASHMVLKDSCIQSMATNRVMHTDCSWAAAANAPCFAQFWISGWKCAGRVWNTAGLLSTMTAVVRECMRMTGVDVLHTNNKHNLNQFITNYTPIKSPPRKQEAPLSPRDRATRCVSWNSAKCCTSIHRICIWKALQQANDLQRYSRSSKMARQVRILFSQSQTECP